MFLWGHWLERILSEQGPWILRPPRVLGKRAEGQVQTERRGQSGPYSAPLSGATWERRLTIHRRDVNTEILIPDFYA